MASAAEATTADLTRLDKILKDRPIQDAIRKAINLATPFAEKITQQLTLTGRKGIFPVQFGVNEGVYARAEKGTFGQSKVDKPLLAEVTSRYIYALFQITGPAMSMTRDTPGSFEEALALTLQNTIDGVKLDMARQIIGDGSGKIALIKSNTDTDTVVVDSAFGITRYKQSRPVRNILRPGMPVDIIDTSSPPDTKHLDDGEIELVVHAADGTTLDFTTADVAGAAADGDFLTRAGNYDLEIQGWEAAVQPSGTYLGLSRTGQPNWQGVMVDASGGGAAADVSFDVLRDTLDTMNELTGKDPEFFTMNYKQRRNVYNLFQAQIRYIPMNLPGGMDDNTLSFDDKPILVERFWPQEHIGVVNTSYWYHVMSKDTEWIPGQGGTVLHFAITSDVFTAVMRTYRNMICLYPATQGTIYGLTE